MNQRIITSAIMAAAFGLVATAAHADPPFGLPQPPRPHVSAPSMPSVPAPHVSAPSMPSMPAPHVSAPSMPSVPAPHVSAPSMPMPHVNGPALPSMPGPRVSAPSMPSMPAPHVNGPAMPTPGYGPPHPHVVVPMPSVTVNGPQYVEPPRTYVEPGPVYVQPGPTYVEGPVYGPPPVYVYRTGEDPEHFAARMEEMMHWRFSHLRAQVDQGEISPRVLDAARADREEVQMRIRDAVADGVITRREARQVSAMVRNLGAPNGGYGYGGGPR